jgi:hypothetical protein
MSAEPVIASMTMGTALGVCTLLCFENALAAVVAGLLVFAASRAAFDVPAWLQSRRARQPKP